MSICNFKSDLISACVGLAILFVLLTCGCKSAVKPVTLAGNVAIKTAEVSGKVAAQGVKTTSKVAGEVGKTGIKTAGELAKTGTKTTAGVAKHQVIYLKDVTTGVLKEIPWKDGLSLYMASQGANLNPYLLTYIIYRNGGEKVIKTDWKKLQKEDIKLEPGDYVEVRKTK